MAFNEHLADRVRHLLVEKNIRYAEKRMFGGLCFMVADKMLLGVEKERLMVRIDPADEANALKKKGAKPMDFTGRVMKGFVFVDQDGVDLDDDLAYWLHLSLTYNPKAKASRKKK